VEIARSFRHVRAPPSLICRSGPYYQIFDFLAFTRRQKQKTHRRFALAVGFARLDGACAKPASSPSQRKYDKRNTAPKAYCDRKP
jgi:hypothetical protein